MELQKVDNIKVKLAVKYDWSFSDWSVFGFILWTIIVFTKAYRMW